MHPMYIAAAAVQAGNADDGLSLSEVLSNMPHDGPAIVIYLMLAVFVGLIWAGSRKRA
jgi:hypothetical protein